MSWSVAEKWKVFEGVPIRPCWCCFCILPTPDGYRSKVGANQGLLQTYKEGDATSESTLESEVSPPPPFMHSKRLTHMWNIHDAVNSARSHRGTFMEQLFWGVAQARGKYHWDCLLKICSHNASRRLDGKLNNYSHTSKNTVMLVWRNSLTCWGKN